MELFKPYRLLFTCALHLHTCSYLLPLYLRVRARPLVMFFVLLSLVTLLKSYPEAGDVHICLALLPLFAGWAARVSFGFVLANAHVYMTLLSPVLLYMWLESGTGNANFFYGVTLGHALVGGWLVSNLLAAVLEFDYRAKHKLKLQQ